MMRQRTPGSRDRRAALTLNRKGGDFEVHFCRLGINDGQSIISRPLSHSNKHFNDRIFTECRSGESADCRLTHDNISVIRSRLLRYLALIPQKA